MARLSASALLIFVLAGCSGDPPAPVACDRFASPGAGAAQELADALQPGEVGCLREGVYEDETVLRVSRGGRPGAPVTIRSAPGGRARLQGTVSVEADHVRLVALEITGKGRQNAIKVYEGDVRLEGNRISTDGRRYSCLLLGGELGMAEETVVRHNLFVDCGNRATNKDHAIYAAEVQGALIEENVIVRPATYAVQLYPRARDVVVRRNRVDGEDSLRGGFVIGGGDEPSSGNLIEGNQVENAQVALRTEWEGAPGRRNVVRGNCLEGEIGDVEGVEVDGGAEDCGLELEPLLRRAGVRDP